jgi:hypothetical protein
MLKPDGEGGGGGAITSLLPDKLSKKKVRIKEGRKETHDKTKQ